MRLERLHRLINEGHAVGEKQNALHPIAAQKKIAQRDDGAVLPAPVVITTSALRSLSFSNASEMRRMARVWGRDYDAFEENGRLYCTWSGQRVCKISPRVMWRRSPWQARIFG
ncbi:MAG TPA: hypothetical protein VIL70_02660, partial [Chthoniobacterales bacterium]